MVLTGVGGGFIALRMIEMTGDAVFTSPRPLTLGLYCIGLGSVCL